MGRWVGRFYEWACECCGAVVQSSAPPAVGEYVCNGCKVEGWQEEKADEPKEVA